MTQIKAAFFDIDGTLLPFHAKALPESTVQALAALRENGVKTLLPQAARRCIFKTQSNRQSRTAKQSSEEEYLRI